MQVWNWLFGNRHTERLHALADQLARESVSAVWVRVRKQAAGMGLSEARGYVRARAALVVQLAVQRELAHRGTRTWRPDPGLLLATTTDAVVRLVLKQLLDTQSVPAQVRRAA
jgi:hypothetical protein